MARFWKIGVAAGLALLVLALPSGLRTSAGQIQQSDDVGSIDPLVLDQLAAQGQTNVFVKMTSDAPLGAAEGIANRVTRLRFVRNALTAHASISQRAIRRYLNRQGFEFQPFWINNSLYVYGADLPLVQALAARSDVLYIRGDHEVPLHLPVSTQPSTEQSLGVEWNIAKIGAAEVWELGITGQGVVVANIDTGVRYTHEALVDQYRGNNGDGTFSHDYNWFDPALNLAAPADRSGHGTHTMGTIVGGDGPGPLSEDIGVAPGAQWIAAKGCGLLFCSDFRLISSAQWMVCPTRVDGSDPDCSKAPHVVNNSWGSGGGDDWYQSYIRSWLVAGIAPVFSLGNSGPQCMTAGSPGDYGLVAGVGATDANDVLAEFSSKGPGAFRPLKPDFVAPGEAVRSSIGSGDSAYAIFSGTSMAAPHVTGTVALIWSANSEVGLLGVYNAIRSTAVTGLGTPPGPEICGRNGYDEYPNDIYGWGRINAAAAVEAVSP